MRKTLLLSVVMVLGTLTATAQQEPGWISLSQQERQLVEGNNAFALKLFGQTRRADESQVLSPLSVTYALGLLNNGATGQTQQQINEVLGAGGLGASVVNQFCRKLLTESATIDEQTRVLISNAIYVNQARGLDLLPAFSETARQYYDVEPESRNFGDGQTLDIINQWASDHTEGMIEKVMDESTFNPDAISYLLNAIYFKGSWTSRFNADSTFLAYFGDGNRTARMMWQENKFFYAWNDVYAAVRLPYGNGAYQMTVFLPHEWKTIGDVLQHLSANGWNSDTYQNYMVSLQLPRFETDTDLQLEEAMQALGMTDAFSGEGFSQMCGNAEDSDYRVWIELMKQSAKIKLDEEGTEASAVTVVGMNESVDEPAGMTWFWANRPFLYIISECSTGAIFFIGQYVGEVPENPRTDISLTAGEQQLVRSNNAFALNLFGQARDDVKSLVLSPLSVTYALGLLNNGAAGQTQQQICDALGFGDSGAQGINQFCRKMLDGSAQADKLTRVDIANTIFVNQGCGYVLQDGFASTANEYYDAQPQSRDFGDGQTLDAINQWASDHTEGMVEKVLDEAEFNPEAVSYLLNAIYFKGQWAAPFDPQLTSEKPFGDKGQRVMMMRRDELPTSGYAANDTYQAISLPYGNGAYHFTVFLPREGKTIGDVLPLLGGLHLPIDGSEYDVNLELPRFEVKTDQDLRKIMQALGVTDAFNPALAEFPYFCNRSSYIELMKQVARIRVDEQGTEAAAVTIIGNETTSMRDFAEMRADRPFLYVITEQSTGAIFFIGQYMGEALTSPNGIVGVRPAAAAEGPVFDLQGRRLGGSAALGRGLYICNGRKYVK